MTLPLILMIASMMMRRRSPAKRGMDDVRISVHLFTPVRMGVFMSICFS